VETRLRRARKFKLGHYPDKSKISTSYVERNNGIIRQHCKRYARLTQAFSKKVENHVTHLPCTRCTITS
jgi:IS1 family transposase